jgi:hypothetical protein
VNLKAPSSSVEAQIKEDMENNISSNKRSSSLILILLGTIICLILIIISLLLSPPSPPTGEPKKIPEKTIIINKDKEEKEVTKEFSEPIKKIVEEEKKKEFLKEAEINTEEKKERAAELELVNKKNEEETVLKQKLEEETLEKEFNKNISEALSAIEKNNFNRAEKNLTAARLLKANEPVIKELKQRITDKRKQLTINNLIQAAQQEEKNEQWLQAINVYKKILSIDANINSIIVKKQRANVYLKLNTILNNIVEKPERLSDDKVLTNAKNSIQLIKSELKEKRQLLYPLSTTPGLTRKISTAEKIINEASIPIKVTIQSDNLTEISIYKVGSFGKLTEKKLTLRPGHYTIVGSREGYRDVRKKVVITATDQLIILNVKCKETI